MFTSVYLRVEIALCLSALVACSPDGAPRVPEEADAGADDGTVIDLPADDDVARVRLPISRHQTA